MAVLGTLAPLAGCHLVFGYAAGESAPGERADMQKDGPRTDSALLREAAPPGQCSALGSCLADRPNRCNAKGEIEPRCSECGCPSSAYRCCVDGRCALPGHECHIFLNADADAYLTSATPEQNFGGATELPLGDDGQLIEEVVLGFPRPDALKSGATITSAKLYLEVVSGPTTVPPGPTMYALLSNVSEVWQENDVNFKNVAVPFMPFWKISLEGGVNPVEVRDAVIEWIASAGFGFHLQPMPIARAKLASREHPTALRPFLEIIYK
jgi:hypothetical protein